MATLNVIGLRRIGSSEFAAFLDREGRHQRTAEIDERLGRPCETDTSLCVSFSIGKQLEAR
jgi:hypothetical protein